MNKVKKVQVFCKGDSSARLADEYKKIKWKKYGLLITLSDKTTYIFPYENLVEVRLFKEKDEA